MALKGNIEVKADGTSYSETVEVGAIYYHSTENKLKLCKKQKTVASIILHTQEL